jgi:hypothetical protein
MRYFTIARIQKWCTEKNMSRLIDALNSTDPEIRKASILCLGEMGDAVALKPLEYVLEHDEDLFVRINVEKAISNIRKVGIDSRLSIEPSKIKVAYNWTTS